MATPTDDDTTSSSLICPQKSSQETTTEQTTFVSTFQPQTVRSSKIISESINLLHPLTERSSPWFFPPICPNTTNIGHKCNTSSALCDVLKPCRNNDNCYNISSSEGYKCSCASDFNGKQCQFDARICNEYTCWNNGTCSKTLNSTFNCTCEPGWEGIHCERKINYCQNIMCQNKGICRPLFLAYVCECLSGSYSGPLCEITATRIIIYQTVSKSFAYIAILALVAVAMFIIIMDILKYCFDIDPTREELERIRRKKQAKNRKPVIQRFVYVNAPLVTPSPEQPISTVEGTAI